MSHSYEELQSLSVSELKDILHKKQIDSVGIFDSDILIKLILGTYDNQIYTPSLPYSYTQLFEEENKRKEEAIEKIKLYLEELKKEVKKPPKKIKPPRKEEVVPATIVENVPSRYTQTELGKNGEIFLLTERFFSRAGLVDSITMNDIDDAFLPLHLQTRSVIVQYQTLKGAKRCKDLFHDFEVSKGIRLSIVKEAPTKLKSHAILSELKDLSSNQLTIVQLKNMFVDENKEDRNYMFELREDVEEQCRQYGVMTGIAINEVDNIVLVRYSSEEEAMKCYDALNGRLFDGRRIEASVIKNEFEEVPVNEEDALLNEFFASIAEEEAKFKEL